MGDEKPGSLYDYDYFGKNSASGLPGDPLFDSRHGDGDGWGEPPDDGERHRERERRRIAAIRHVVVSLSFLAVITWFLASHRDWIVYSFMPLREPVAVGSAVGISREQLPHNRYVAIDGVTLHRGLVQEIVRGFGFLRKKLHYLELSGSKGVFIEVPPERGIGFATEVSVQGRVVDPKRDYAYSTLLEKYEKLYLQKRRPAERIIQVGVKPGVQRVAIVSTFVVLLLLIWLNAWVLIRALRAVKRGV